VQVEVGDVATEAPRRAQADHGVEVGAVDVHLPAVLVDDVADLADAFLEHAVGGGVGDHQGGQALVVGFGLGAQVVDVHVAAAVAGHHQHLHAGHAGGGRVGAVGRSGDQAQIAVGFAPALVPGADGQQPGVLALGTGVGLQGYPVVAADGAEHGFQLGD